MVASKQIKELEYFENHFNVSYEQHPKKRNQSWGSENCVMGKWGDRHPIILKENISRRHLQETTINAKALSLNFTTKASTLLAQDQR